MQKPRSQTFSILWSLCICIVDERLDAWHVCLKSIFLIKCFFTCTYKVRDHKPVQVISPNIKIHSTELKKHKDGSDTKKKGLFGSGLDLLFKKDSKGSKDKGSEDESGDEKKWKPFEKLKRDKKKEGNIFLQHIYTLMEKTTHDPEP